MNNAILLLLLIICLITDFKKKKIYNIVLLPALLSGVFINITDSGWSGAVESGQGFLLGLAILFVPFALGGIGAGDVKLLAVIGAIKGPEFVFYNGLGMGIAGGVIAVIILIYQKKLFKTVKEIITGFLIMLGSKFKIFSFHSEIESISFPYGAAIALGAAAAFMVMG